MAQNVEIKARVADPVLLRKLATELTGCDPEVIHQKDTFFSIPTGRLKLRDFGDGHGELIRYQRPDASGPKVSDYAISGTNDPHGLTNLLAGALPVLGIVQKTRTLFLAGRTRIHLDEVLDLGWFMELEVVLSDGDSVQDGEAEAQRLMEALGVQQNDLVQGAYLDLLSTQNRD
jgi:adenylate cyclase class IV